MILSYPDELQGIAPAKVDAGDVCRLDRRGRRGCAGSGPVIVPERHTLVFGVGDIYVGQ